MNLAGAKWFKSSRSSGNGACVEIAIVIQGVALRDTKDREGGTLTFTHGQWSAFIGGTKNGEFDL